MRQQLIVALRKTADEINKLAPICGMLALRKVNALDENSSLKAIIRTGDDLVLMASKVQKATDDNNDTGQPLASGKGWTVANV